MGLILKLTDVTFTTPDLPVIGDYGKLYTNDLLGLYKMASDTDKYADSSEEDNDMSYAGTAVGAGVPTWASGVLTVPDANAVEAGKYNRLALAAYDADLTKTFVILAKPGTASAYVLHNCPVNLFTTAVSGGVQLQLIYNNGSTRTVAMQTINNALYHLILLTTDASSASISVDGGTFTTHPFASLGGAPTPSANTAYMGAANTSQALRGDFAFVAQYDRSMTQVEAISMYRGIKAWAASTKGITI